MLFRLSIECPDLQEIVREFRKLNHLLTHLVGPPKPYGSLSFTLTSELGNMLNYNVSLPSLPEVPEASDVVKGLLKLSISTPSVEEGGEPTVSESVVETAVGQAVVEGVSVEQGVTVSASFVFVDDAGNESVSPVVAESFVATDTIPAPNPEGGLGFTLVSEG